MTVGAQEVTSDGGRLLHWPLNSRRFSRSLGWTTFFSLFRLLYPIVISMASSFHAALDDSL